MRDVEWINYTGGPFETNAFLVQLPGGDLLVDAPEGVADWVRGRGRRIGALFLTHGHFDHTWDAATVARDHQCSVLAHPDTMPMLQDPDYFVRRGFPFPVEPVGKVELVEETERLDLLGASFRVLLVPGHCPGSLCLLHIKRRVLFGGDVLFAGGVGRWDLPGGAGPLLFRGIREKLFPLGDDIVVLPGHGPATTLGEERRHNPFVGES